MKNKLLKNHMLNKLQDSQYIRLKLYFKMLIQLGKLLSIIFDKEDIQYHIMCIQFHQHILSNNLHIIHKSLLNFSQNKWLDK